MAVTITAADLLAALRLGSTAEETAQAERLLTYATTAVEKHAPDAPEAVQNEAVIRVAAYEYDRPTAPRGSGYASSLRNSGAASMLLPYRTHRGGSTSTDTPSTSPTVSTGGPGVDQVARDAAAAAQATADTAQAAADANTALLAEPSDDEADAGTATTVRGWSAALIRRVVEAIVPSWARGADPPASLATDAEVAAAVAAEAASRNAAIDAAVVPAADRARIPNPALPAPSMSTRGHLLKQASDGETYVFEQGTGVVDAQARSDAKDAAAAANEAKDAAQAASHQARDVQHLAEDNHQHIEALEDGGLLTTGYGDWALWTVDEYNAGFHLATSLDNTFRAEDFHGGSNVFSGVATNRRIAMSVPASVDPARVRLRLTLNGAESFKPGAGEAWEPFTPTDANTRRDYYYLAVASSGNHVVTTFAANDRVDLQIRPIVPVLDEGRLLLDGTDPGAVDRVVEHYIDGLHSGPFNPHYTVSIQDSRRTATAGIGGVNSALYDPQEDGLVRHATLYFYLRVPTAQRDVTYEQDSSLIVYRRDTKAVIAARPIRAPDGDERRTWQTDNTVLTKYATVFGFDYFEMIVTGLTPTDGTLPFQVYFGAFRPLSGDGGGRAGLTQIGNAGTVNQARSLVTFDAATMAAFETAWASDEVSQIVIGVKGGNTYETIHIAKGFPSALPTDGTLISWETPYPHFQDTSRTETYPYIVLQYRKSPALFRIDANITNQLPANAEVSLFTL